MLSNKLKVTNVYNVALKLTQIKNLCITTDITVANSVGTIEHRQFVCERK